VDGMQSEPIIVEKIAETSSMQTFKVKSTQTIQDILKHLDLEHKYFAVLVNGKRVQLTEVVIEGSEILILPKIAGG
jgi:sulfur carrier protein ThiS